MDSTFVLKRGGIISDKGDHISDEGIKERKKCIYTFFYLLSIIGLILERPFTLLIKSFNKKFGVFCVLHKVDRKRLVEFI